MVVFMQFNIQIKQILKQNNQKFRTNLVKKWLYIALGLPGGEKNCDLVSTKQSSVFVISFAIIGEPFAAWRRMEGADGAMMLDVRDHTVATKTERWE